MLNYTRNVDPVQQILNSDISNCEKIELIDELLVSKYNILPGRMSRMLATVAVGDKMLIGREKSKDKKIIRGRKKKRK